jgi:hypothetical protein
MRLAAIPAFTLLMRSFGVLLGVSSFALIALILLVPASAQQGDVNAITKRFMERYAAGDYAAALVEAQALEAVGAFWRQPCQLRRRAQQVGHCVPGAR